MDWRAASKVRKDDPEYFQALSAAVQDSLGLKLEAAKDQVEILVIDHLEKPAAN